jgi:hypothetical protein
MQSWVLFCKKIVSSSSIPRESISSQVGVVKGISEVLCGLKRFSLLAVDFCPMVLLCLRSLAL